MTYRFIKRILPALLATLLIGTLLGATLGASAAAPTMTWNKGDKGYISIVIDDNNSELPALYNLITVEYGFPLCAAVPVNSINDTNIETLRTIEKSGGEILSHTYSHKVLTADITDEEIEREICGSYTALLDKGFNVNGIILAGGGGTEDTSEAFRARLEPYTARCYQYSDKYGVSTQFYHPRSTIAGNLPGAKNTVDNAIKNKSWEPIYAHGLTKDVATINEDMWRRFLDYLKEKQDAGELEVVTYRTAHETLGNWSETPDFDPIKSHVSGDSTSAPAPATTTTAPGNTDNPAKPFPILPIAIGGGAVVIGGVIATVVIAKKKK